MTTATLAYRTMYHKVTLLSLTMVSRKVFLVLSIIFFSCAVVFYIILVNELTRGVYTIKNYNKEISALFRDNKVLETNFAKGGFLGKVTDRVGQLGFEKTTEVMYIEILNNSLAKAK